VLKTQSSFTMSQLGSVITNNKPFINVGDMMS